MSAQCALLEAKYELSTAVNSACHAATKAAHDAEIAASNATHAIIVTNLTITNLYQCANFVSFFPLTTSMLFKQ